MRKKSLNLLYDAAKTVTELESKSGIDPAVVGPEAPSEVLKEARHQLHVFLEQHRDDGYRSQKRS